VGPPYATCDWRTASFLLYDGVKPVQLQGVGVFQQDEIFMQGVELMIFGVGAVAIFLSLLVLVTSLTSSFLSRYFPEQREPSVLVETVCSAVLPAVRPGQPERVAVIAAAIQQHRKQRH
jgi:oxaloacetate decarboxylase (Na+ extruding) subunit gamma